MSYKQVLIPILLFGVLIVLVIINKEEGVMAGMARVVDGATIVVDGKRVQLAGLKPLALDRVCPGATESETWPCGRQAFIALSKLIDRQRVECQAIGVPDGGVLQGACQVDGRDLTLALIGVGWGAAGDGASDDMRRAETSARELRKGLWR